MKKTRLLEIIREEIDTAINEIPVIGLEKPEDISYDKESKTTEIGGLAKAINNAIDKIKENFPEADKKKITSYIVSKKARKNEEIPQAVRDALKKIDDAIGKQRDTLDDPKILKILKDLSNKPKSNIDSEIIDKYISGEKRFSDKLQSPQTARAVDRYLGEELSDEEPSEPDSTAKDLGDKAERMAQAEKSTDDMRQQVELFLDKMKEEGVVRDDNKILDAKKYNEELAKFKKELK
jgi:hypothetical protein